jgi:hypothetical protein
MVNGLRLYIPREDLNNYIRDRVDAKYKDNTFIPVKAEVNECDLSVEIWLVSADPISATEYRYRIDLDALAKPKKKKKQVKEDNTPLPGQISFFDEGENNV